MNRLSDVPRAAASALPRAAGAGLARTLVERNALSFRRQWVAFATGFAEPVFYLFSLGIGLGALVGSVTTDAGRSVPYAVFVAPAMLATSAMNAGVMDSTFNVFFKMHYMRIYHTMLSTSLGPLDVALGEIGWAMLRGAAYAIGFTVVVALFGLITSWWALLMIPGAVLVAFSFASIGMTLTSYMKSFHQLNWLNFWLLPLFFY